MQRNELMMQLSDAHNISEHLVTEEVLSGERRVDSASDYYRTSWGSTCVTIASGVGGFGKSDCRTNPS
jgi:hypothetical protein